MKQHIEIPRTPLILRNAKTPLKIDNIKIRNLYELVDILETLPDHLFELHLRADDNLSRWIRHNFANDTLAKDTSRAQTIMQTQNSILKHLTRALSELNNKTFHHYLSTPYANWIKIRITDKNLARRLNTAEENEARTLILEKLHSIVKAQRNIIKSDKKTQLTLTPYREIIRTDQKTNLPLGQLILHEVNASHHGVVQIASYLSFGVVVGGALVVMILAFV